MDMALIISPLTWNQDLSCLATHENVWSRSTGAMHKKVHLLGCVFLAQRRDMMQWLA